MWSSSIHTGTTYFTLFEGDADAKLMTHICFDAFAPGNHEFDKGDAGLAKFLTALETETKVELSSTCEAMGLTMRPQNPHKPYQIVKFLGSKAVKFGQRHGAVFLLFRIAGSEEVDEA